MRAAAAFHDGAESYLTVMKVGGSLERRMLGRVWSRAIETLRARSPKPVRNLPDKTAASYTVNLKVA